MKAMLFDGQTLRYDAAHRPPMLAPGEAIIQPHLVGICNTDVEITRGYMGFRGVLGHEFVGTVIACEDADWIGKRVVGDINASCDTCDVCRGGDRPHCPERTTLGIDRRDGAMAEQFSLPVSCLYEVPPTVSDRAAVFTEPLAAALAILDLFHIRPTDRVAVIGDGKLGLMCAQVLRLPGADVTLVGRHPERWEPWQQLGLTTLLAEQVRGQFDVVVDCTGQPKGLETARRLVRPRGRLVLKSTFAGESGLNLSMLVVDEIALLGSRCGPFAPALNLLARGLVATEPLIYACYPLAEGMDAFRAAHGNLKVLLEV